jgi:predicted AAA+ superfamily ATPase
MVKRDVYIQHIEPYIGKPLIKVLTGIRRCGKSSILMLLMEELRARGISEEHLIYINFENLKNRNIASAVALHEHLLGKMPEGGGFYVLLDEIQEVDQWERAVNSLLSEGNADIYITGSNSRLLSSELATYIAGRYIEIKIKPLSFAEYLLFKEHYSPAHKHNSPGAELENYIRLGGFPIAHIGIYSNDEEIYRIINDIYASAILRDTVQRHKIRNIEILERVVRYVFDNIGNTFSAKGVADYFRNEKRRIDPETVYNYLSALEDAFIIRRIPRYDIKGKEILKTQEKYYAGDHSLVYAVMGYRDRIIAGILENIVLHEMEGRGYAVYVGKLDAGEVDFVGERRGQKIYVQVSYRLGDVRETIEREFAPLLKIKDQYPKYVISMDDFWKDDVEGVRYCSIADFLLMDDWR